MSSQAILNQQNGVEKAEVNFANSSVNIQYDPDVVSPEELKSVLEKIGFNLIIESSAYEKKK
jgi:Cu2+-exporting ATPase